MEQQHLKELELWFSDYVRRFYGGDEFVNANLKLKEEHSRRTCREMLYLVDKLGLPENQRRIARLIALFHDIGRFKQFAEHQTYNDPKSVDHCLLGLEVLRQTNILDGLENSERQLVEKAIEYHGVKELPKGLNGRCLLFSQLIRDADKVDIFYVATEFYAQYARDPQKCSLEIELPNEPRYSDEVVQALLDGQKIDYHRLKTWNDMKLMQLGWVYDVNFTPTLERIKDRRFLEKIADFLPQNEEMKKVKEKTLEYVDNRIQQNT